MPTGELKSEMYCTEYFIFSLVSVDLSSIIILSLSIPLSHRYSYIASASVLFSPRPCPPDTIILHSVLTCYSVASYLTAKHYYIFTIIIWLLLHTYNYKALKYCKYNKSCYYDNSYNILDKLWDIYNSFGI